MGSGNDAYDRSFPELLAAYADGELDAAGRAHVEAWLAEHPDAQTTLAVQFRLSRQNRKLWKASAPLAPSEGNWARVFGRVQDVLDSPVRPAQPRPNRRRLRYVAAALATAAALVAALYLTAPKPVPGPDNVAPPRAADDALALAGESDISIISIDDRDVGALVVGKSPLSGPVVLAAIGDVDLKGIQKAEDGMLPTAKMNEAGLAPMIVAPIAGR
jgi:hypothetical protein